MIQSFLYIISTQLRIVDETHLFNRQAYNKAHKKLKATNVRSLSLSSSCESPSSKYSLQCGWNTQFISPNKRLCARSYRNNGHWETRLQLEIPTGNETETELQWAYPPYLSTLANAAGPLVNTPFSCLVNIFFISRFPSQPGSHRRSG
jgi:hypothetical protein